MERTRKKSSKQLLEEKQMKRYFRSKKRSHSRAKTENEEKVEENPNKKSEANSTGGLENQKTKGEIKQGPDMTTNENQKTKSLSKQGPGMMTNEKSIEKQETSEKVTIDDSSVTQLSDGKGKPLNRNADIPKTNRKFNDINNLETTKTFECSMEMAECTKEGEDREEEPNIVAKHSSAILTSSSTKEENTIAYTHTGSQMTAIEKYNSNDNKDRDSKLATETSENDARASDQIPMNDAALSEMTKAKITKADTSQTEEQVSLRHYLLDCPNVWLDKYRYEDAEEQYYKHLAKDQQKQIFKTSNNKITFLDPVKVNVNDIDSEDKNDAARDFVKPKKKFFYEIIEEIVERTEITYQLIPNANAGTQMHEQMKIFESKGLESKQYIKDLGFYVKNLEKRVKTLEGKKKTMGDRSGSLSSNTSDEGVDVSGRTDSILDFQVNMMKDEQNKVKDLFILPRTDKRPLVY